ncbi:MAG TPA: M66 family metalloprotease, partial [Polyangiaceae bacterium]|nr:M66 family metalloprotease [Polyangiaceae bacterium]
SSGALGPYRELLRAMYPVNSVELSVASSVSTGYPLNWTTMLDQIRAKRASDGAPADVYYYGLVKPNDTLSQYCGGGCVAGIGYVAPATQASVRAAVGIGFADNTSASTMAHELGHNHGRNHAPCAPGSISGVDAAFPHPGALIGTWGFDPRNRALFDPARTTDIMGYCNNKWISDYTYKAITQRVATVNGALSVIEDSALIANWQVMLIEPPASRWGLPFETPATPFGQAEAADVLDTSGNVVQQITVYRTEASDIGSFTVLVPPAQSSWHAVRVNGAAPLTFSAPVTVPAP